MNGLPVVGHSARVLADQVVGDLQGPCGAGLGVILEHLAPAYDSSIGGDLDKDPTVSEDETLELRDLDLIVRTDGCSVRADGMKRIKRVEGGRAVEQGLEEPGAQEFDTNTGLLRPLITSMM